MSKQDLEMVRQEAYRAFLGRDHERAVRLASQLAQANAASKQERLLIPISLIRMGRPEAARAIFNEAKPDLETNPYGPLELWFFKLVLGDASLAEVLRVATDRKERCQAYYYEGARRLTEFDEDAARKAFRECLNMRITCLEAQLAQCELDNLG